jgi:hypothetical protein
VPTNFTDRLLGEIAAAAIMLLAVGIGMLLVMSVWR